MLARLYHRVDMGHKAMEVLKAHIDSYPEATDLTHVNILAELYMEEGKFEQAAGLISYVERELPCAQAGLPVDLMVRCLPQ